MGCKTLTRQEVRELDRRAVEQYGMPSLLLMENAGSGVARWLGELFTRDRPIWILCGPGNNGGDGYVVARHLENLGFLSVRAIEIERPTEKVPDAWLNYQIARNCGLLMREIPNPFPEGSIIVDALFGTGLTRGLSEPFATLIDQINSSNHIVVAVDLPSGFDCDTGVPFGPCIQADYTATFVAWKTGFTKQNAKDWLGQIKVIDIGAPAQLVREYLGE